MTGNPDRVIDVQAALHLARVEDLQAADDTTLDLLAGDLHRFLRDVRDERERRREQREVVTN